MGLDIVIDDETGDTIWHRSYSAFAMMRGWLADQIVAKYNSDGAAQTLEDIISAAQEKNAPEGVVPLFMHSDCEGEWTLEECKQVVEVLQELVGHNPLFNTFAEEYESYAKFVRREAAYDESLDAWVDNMERQNHFPMIFARILLDGLKVCVARGVGVQFM